MKKSKIIGIILVTAVVLGAAGLIHRANTSVTALSIVHSESSIELSVGDTLQLSAAGTQANGETASSAALERLHLRWQASKDDVIRVDDTGLVTAIAPGFANVQVKSKSGNINSRPITVFVV